MHRIVLVGMLYCYNVQLSLVREPSASGKSVSYPVCDRAKSGLCVALDIRRDLAQPTHTTWMGSEARKEIISLWMKPS